MPPTSYRLNCKFGGIAAHTDRNPSFILFNNYATELLACSDDPDGKVKFGIGTNVAFAPKFTLSVARYSHALDRNRPLAQVNGDEETTEICVKGLAATNSTPSDDCSLNVVPLGSPNDLMPADTVVSTGSCSWLVNHGSYPPGYYLVLATDAQGNSYRPLRFVVKASELKVINENGDDSRPAFWSVMNTYNKSSRLKAWDNYFKDVAEKPAHFSIGLNSTILLIRVRRCQ